MKQFLILNGKKLLHVVITAGVASGIAFIQSLLSQHGVECGPAISPVASATIGGGLATTQAYLHTLNSMKII